MPLRCSICPGTFPTQLYLDKHLADVHNMGGAKQHKCDMCVYTSFDVFDLNQHKIKSHFQNKLQRPF